MEIAIAAPGSGTEIKRAAKAAMVKMLEYYSKTDNDADAYMVALMCNPQFNVGYMVEKEWDAALVAKYRALFLRVLRQYDTQPVPEVVGEEVDPYEVHVYARPKARGLGQTLEQEVAAFHGELRIAEDEDVLLWWMARRTVYPRIYLMAMDYLAIQGTSTAAERDFSAAGLIMTKIRASMRVKTLETVFLVKSWYAFLKRRTRRGK